MSNAQAIRTDITGNETARIFKRLSPVMTKAQLKHAEPYIREINRLKRERNAVILAHNYQTPDIFFGVADITGDSLKLAQEASKTSADVILQAGVYFMAETSKLLNPDKTVLIPSLDAGCSLAASITPEDVLRMKEKYPDVPVVSYVNTSAGVKAVSDICCTSGNAVKIVNALGSDRVIFLPDEYLANYVAAQTKVKIIPWEGRCEVHERFTPEYIRELRAEHPGVTVLAHPECAPEVLAESDFTGSTAQISDYVEQEKPQRVVLITECSMSDNVYAENPELEFIRPCQLCPHMKKISLENILHCLETTTHEVTIDPAIQKPALRAIEKMLEVG